VPVESVVLTGPQFWTGDPARPLAEAILVHEGKIVRLMRRADLPRAIAQGAAVVEVPGNFAVPGLVDAHAHLAGYALSRRSVDLVGAGSLDEALNRIREFASAHPDEDWIEGRGWDQTDWSDKAWPDADRLEQIVSGRPAALSRIDGHALWVNRTALAAAGIDHRTPDPPGGKIHRDSQGRPTGILVDNATPLVEGRIPPASEQEFEQALALAAQDLLSVGLTGVHDMGSDDRLLSAIGALSARGQFPLRITAYAGSGTTLHERLLRSGPFVEGRVQVVGVKFYADGALGSRGARLLAPYSDEPGSYGLWVTEPARLQAAIEQALDHGLQPAVHAIGDAANRAVLDALQAAAENQPKRAAEIRKLRPRLEHAQVVDPSDRPRFASLGVIASMQPTHATSDMPWVEARLGAQRQAGAYAWRSLSDLGVPLAFGSDFPVEAIDPRHGLYAAVTRTDLSGRPVGGWMPSERLSLEEALAGFSFGPAYAARQEETLGRLVPGAWCDVTVFAENLLTAPIETLPRVGVTATIIGGQRVWPNPN
jgi:predicted amidohydrolase YtcJ